MIRRVLCLLTLLGGFAFPVQEQERLTLEDLRNLLQSGTDEGDLIRLIDGAGSLDVAEADFDKLRGWGASDKVIGSVRKKLKTGGGFSIDEVTARVSRGVAEEEILTYILEEGRPLTLTAQQKLQLSRQKVSPNLLLALEGKYVHPGFSSYKDPLGMLAIQYPKGWSTYHWYTGEGVKVLLSPETGVPEPNKFVTGIQIQLSFLEKGHPLLKPGADIVEYTKSTLASSIRLNREYELEALSEPQSRRVSGRPAVEQLFHVTMMKKRCKDLLVQFAAEDIYYYVELIAPKENFAELEGAFRKTIQTLRPRPDHVQVLRRGTPLKSDQVLELYREAVVKIQAPNWSGTGFFVREDGLILTNHHVVCGQQGHAACTNPANWKLVDGLEAVWDSKVEPKPPGETNRRVKVQLWDTIYSLTPQMDLALLKAPTERAGYRTIPLAPAKSGLVKDGDEIVAIGFPLPGVFGGLLFTKGSVARIVPIERRYASPDQAREYDHVILDITARGGNSGGPCVSLDTGAVLCMITQAPSAPESLRADVLEYDQSTLIDHALEQFPQIRWYPRGGRMGPLEHMELGSMLLAKGNTRSAWVELWQAERQVDELESTQRARLYHQLFAYFCKVNDSEQARKMLAQSISADPAYPAALRDQAYEHAYAGKLDRAMPLVDKLVSLTPDDWVPYYHQADLFRLAGQFDDALRCLKEAESREAGYDPGFHRLRGQVYYQTGDLEKGKEAYQQAAKIDPKDAEARLALADYHVRKKQSQAALLEYGRIVHDFPHEPSVLETVGRFYLTLPNREKDAQGNFLKAVDVVLDRGESPAGALLRDAANLHLTGSATPDERWIGFELAQLLHQKWAAWGGWAHHLLAGFWSGMGDKYAGIAWAHYQAGERYTQSTHPEEDPGKYTCRPLALEELLALIGEVSNPLLFSEVLDETNLGFEVTEEVEKEILKQRGITNWKIATMIKRIKADMTKGGGAFAGWLNYKLTGSGVQTADRIGPWTTIEVSNTGTMPLCPVRCRMFYMDKDQKVLWSNDADIAFENPVLRPGQTRSWQFRFDDWATLEKQGLKNADIQFFQVRILSARYGVGAASTGAAPGTLGAKLRALTADERKKRGLKEGVGVLVTEVVKDGPAARGGLKADDVIARVDDDLVGTESDVEQRIGRKAPGSKATLTIQRGGKYWTLEVVVGKAP